MALPPDPVPVKQTVEKRERTLKYLAEACDLFSEARRKRAAKFPFTTLNEEAAISNLRLRLKEYDDA